MSPVLYKLDVEGLMVLLIKAAMNDDNHRAASFI